MKKKWSSGKIAALVFASVAAVMVLVLTFCISVFQLIGKAGSRSDRIHRGNEEYSEYADLEDNEEGDFDFWENRDQKDSEYYEFHNEIREDLSYQIRFENYGSFFGEKNNVSVKIEYPIVSGLDPLELEGINAAIYKEVAEVNAYGESVADQIPSEETYEFEVECYVTYMDEEILSVIYQEYGYLDDEVYESYVVSVNIDMESKMALTNTQLLAIDDDFSIDFRERCEKQNGEIWTLENFSDQNITELLTDNDTLIIFYTPMGMEVGFNFYYGWVTVTYQDYQKYRTHI